MHGQQRRYHLLDAKLPVLHQPAGSGLAVLGPSRDHILRGHPSDPEEGARIEYH